MWKERHDRYGVAATNSTTRSRPPRLGPHHRYNYNRSSTSSTTVDVLPQSGVGIIPGNRFFLLPLKKVTALVRPHTRCSATSTKPCITPKGPAVQLATPATKSRNNSNRPSIPDNVAVIHQNEKLQYYSRQAAHNSRRLGGRLIVKHRHRLAIAKSRLSPVSEQVHSYPEQESLLALDEEYYHRENINRGTSNSGSTSCSTNSAGIILPETWLQQRSKKISVFSLNEPPNYTQSSCRLLRSQAAAGGNSTPQVVSNLNYMGHTSVLLAKKKKKLQPEETLSSSFYNNVSHIDLIRYRTSRRNSLAKTRFTYNTATSDMISDHSIGPRVGRSFGRNNRVSPSFGTSEQAGQLVTPWKRRNRNVGCSGVSHQIRSCSPFLCSFTNENDLPIRPTLSRRLQPKGAAEVIEV